jgi:hypothetical protein
MIQRPQTVLLLFIILLMAVALFLPNWQKSSPDGAIHIVQTAFEMQVNSATPGQETKIISRWYIGVGMILVAALAGFSISQYKKRMNQLKIGFGLTLSVTLCLVAIMLGGKEGEAFTEPARHGEYGYGFYLLFISLFLNMISNRLIRRDEHLVRSMDRIR